MENTNGNNDNQYNSNSLFINRLMSFVFKHPNYYKKLRANRQQATSLESSGNGRVGPEPTSAKRKNKIVDSRLQVWIVTGKQKT